MRTINSLIASKLIFTNESITIERVGGSNSKVDKVVIEINIVDKAIIGIFQPKMAKSNKLI